MEDSAKKHRKNDAYTKAFGEHLRTLRKEKKMSVYDLDGKSGVHYNLISRFERAEVNPSLITIYDLAKGLGVEPYELLKFEFEE